MTPADREKMREVAQTALDFVPMKAGESRTLVASFVGEGTKCAYLPAARVLALLDFATVETARADRAECRLKADSPIKAEALVCLESMMARVDAIDKDAVLNPHIGVLTGAIAMFANACSWLDAACRAEAALATVNGHAEELAAALERIIHEAMVVWGQDEATDVQFCEVMERELGTAARVLAAYRASEAPAADNKSAEGQACYRPATTAGHDRAREAECDGGSDV